MLPWLLAAVLLPPVLFLGLAFVLSLNYPLLDDYDAGLAFANHMVLLHGLHDRLLYFLAVQHNEYKIFLGHGFVWLQLALAGHVNFAVLSALGNLFIPLLGFILWKLFLPEVPLERRLTLFIPVSLMLFQYEYWETINWPLPGLQNLTIVPFAFGCFYLLGRGTRPTFLCGLACMVFGISASGNGFIIGAVGLLMLALRRSYARLAALLAALAASAAVYAYHYNSMATQNPGHQSLLTVLTHPHGVYLLAFLGNAAGLTPRLPFLWASVMLGAFLCAFYAWALRRGFLRREPVVGYCLLFLLLTAIGVSGLRSGLGLIRSTSSRYQLYSDLLLVFAWFALVRLAGLDRTSNPAASPLFRRVLALSLLFYIGATAIGLHGLLSRDALLKRGLADFERSGGLLSPVYVSRESVLYSSGWTEHARTILAESQKLGVYTPR